MPPLYIALRPALRSPAAATAASFNQSAAANPAIASRSPSTRPGGGSLNLGR